MYNVYNCNAIQLREVLHLGYRTGMPIYISGAPGIGKSEIVAQFAKEIKANFPNPLILSSIQPEDVRGIGIPNRRTKRLDFFQLGFFPPEDSEERWVLFYDELSNADKRLQAPLQQLILHRQTGDYTLPPDCYQVAAGNSLEDQCFAYELSRALEDRFCIVNLKVAVEPWTKWAIDTQVHTDIISFIKIKPEYLHYSLTQEKYESAQDERVLPTPRAWGKYVNMILKDQYASRTAKEIAISGLVGIQVANCFFNTLDELKDMPTCEEIINASRKKTPTALQKLLPKSTVGLWNVSLSLLNYCENTEHYKDLAKYLEILLNTENDLRPVREIAMLVLEKAIQKAPERGIDRVTLRKLFSEVTKTWYKEVGDLLNQLQS